jgi:hypothetical protein
MMMVEVNVTVGGTITATSLRPGHVVVIIKDETNMLIVQRNMPDDGISTFTVKTVVKPDLAVTGKSSHAVEIKRFVSPQSDSTVIDLPCVSLIGKWRIHDQKDIL